MSLQALGFLASWGIVAWGQPARIGALGALAAICGFALFFATLPTALSKKQRFLRASLWFAAVQLVQLSWMTSIEFQGYYILFVYLFLALGIGCQFGVLSLLIPAEGKISKLKLLFCAALWTLMEWTRLFPLCGFSWNPVGLALTFHHLPLQFASVAGIFGLSFWAMLTNLVALNVWRNAARVLHVVCLAAVPYAYGAMQFHYHIAKSEKKAETLNVALVQTDLLPPEKLPLMGKSEDFISPYLQWSRILKALKAEQSSQWDLIVLPEAAVPLHSDVALFPFDIVRIIFHRELFPFAEQKFPSLYGSLTEHKTLNQNRVICVSNLFLCQALANHFNAEVIVGLDHADARTNENFNSAFYLKPNGEHYQRYDKQILLPLAEYLPLEFLRSLANDYGVWEFFTPGKESIVFGEKISMSPSICYEETFPELIREGRSKGARLFVNLTNDNYFPNSSLHDQHLYHARVRSVENGTPLIRACNSGVSAAIDSFGRIIASKPVPKGLRSSEGEVVSCCLNAYTFPTLYTMWGDAFIIGCSLTICFAFACTRTLRLKNKLDVDSCGASN